MTFVHALFVFCHELLFLSCVFSPVKRKPKKQEKLYCPVCGKLCISTTGLKVHQRVHLRDTSLDCNICQMTFPSRAAQSAHMTIHNVEKTHQCPCCPLRFASDRALQGHFRVHHKGSDMAQEQRRQLQPQAPQSPPGRGRGRRSQPKGVQRRGKKKPETERETPEPQMSSGQQSEMPVAKPRGNREKIRISKLNRKAFLQASRVQQATYLQQVIEETRKPVAAQTSSQGPNRHGVYRCNICKKAFRELHFLEKHIVIHMAVRLHKCTLCGESYDSARALNAHQSEVHDNGQYVCSICGRNMHKLGSLLNHQVLHEQEGIRGKAKKQKKPKVP